MALRETLNEMVVAVGDAMERLRRCLRQLEVAETMAFVRKDGALTGGACTNALWQVREAIEELSSVAAGLEKIGS